MVVYRGILELIDSDDTLAFLMGHEMAHAICRHGGEKVSWDQSEVPVHAVLMLTLYGMLPWFIAAPAELLIAAAETVVGDLPFSRTMETEADHVGLLLMARACYDPNKGAR